MNVTHQAAAVDEIMSRQVVAVGMDDTLGRVRELFEAHRFHHLVVTEPPSPRLVGVISDRDLLKNLSPFIGKMSERAQDAASLRVRVHQVMSRRLVTVHCGESICRAIEVMLAGGVSCLPVVDAAGVCRGVLTWRDMLRWSRSGGACATAA